jgi:putative phosphoesterase
MIVGEESSGFRTWVNLRERGVQSVHTPDGENDRCESKNGKRDRIAGASKQHRVGIISDTHGILSAQIWEVFKTCDLIIHAGDIDRPELLTRLKEIAPVVAVRGNMDVGRWSVRLPPWDIVKIGQVSVYVIHDIADLDLGPDLPGIRVVISGHTHKPEKQKTNGVWYVNPGSAGAPRSGRRPSVALLHIKGDSVTAELIEL